MQDIYDSEQAQVGIAVEDPENPYLGVIHIDFIPPHKRCQDIENLSGGEKAIAAIALLISVHG